jgi:hypothetical protein
MDQKEEASGHEKIYGDLLDRLQRADVSELARRKDLPLRPDGKVVVKSFGRVYFVCPEGVMSADAGPVSIKQGLAVTSYLFSKGEGEPSNEFVPFGRLGGFNIGRGHHDGKSLKTPILSKFGDDYDLLARAARKIGGIEEESTSQTEHVWLFHAFPKLLLRLIFHERDNDFPADVHVLFETKAFDFFGFECLGFLPDYFTSTLFEAVLTE